MRRVPHPASAPTLLSRDGVRSEAAFYNREKLVDITRIRGHDHELAAPRLRDTTHLLRIQLWGGRAPGCGGNRSGEGRFCLHDLSLVLDKPRRNHLSTPERNTRSNQEHTHSDDEANEPTLTLPVSRHSRPIRPPSTERGESLAGDRCGTNQAFQILREAVSLCPWGDA